MDRHGAGQDDDDGAVDVKELLAQHKANRTQNAKEIIAQTKWGPAPDLNNMSIAQYILRDAARLGNDQGETALSSIVDLVRTQGGDDAAQSSSVDARDGRGNTALTLATRWGHLDLIKQLVSAGADPNSTACYYEFGPAFDPAAAEAHVRKGANGARGAKFLSVDVTTQPGMVAEGDLTPVLAPPDGSAKQSGSHRNATGEATITGEGKEAKKLLYPSWGQLIVETPMHNAAEKSVHALRALLSAPGCSANLSVSPEGFTPLHVASTTVKNGQRTSVELLLERGAAVNAKDAIGMTPLAWVCTSPRPPNLRSEAEEVAIALISGGAVVNGALDEEGSTCLHGAAVLGYGAVCEALVKAGADTEACTVTGMTPLLSALSVSRAGAALALIRMGANVNIRRKEGRSTALHWAAGNGNEPVITALLKAGASVNALDHHCVSPLLAAAGRGQLATCRLLCRWGANDRLYNLDGHAPYSLARLKGFSSTSHFLTRFRHHYQPLRLKVLLRRAQFLQSNPEHSARIAEEWKHRSDESGSATKRYMGGGSIIGGSTRGGMGSDAASTTYSQRQSAIGPAGGGPVSST